MTPNVRRWLLLLQILLRGGKVYILATPLVARRRLTPVKKIRGVQP